MVIAFHYSADKYQNVSYNVHTQSIYKKIPTSVRILS